MHTQVASGDPSVLVDIDPTPTAEIDFTVDLATPQLAAAPLQQPTPERQTSPPTQPVYATVPSLARPVARAEPRLPIAPGRVLCDRYVLTQIIGIGDMCTVFRARDLEATPASGRPAFVALKTPRPDYPDRERAVERLKRAFDCAQRLSHGGFVRVFELGNEDDVWFLTMEVLEGESLASIMTREAGALPPYLVRQVLRGLGDALRYAHAANLAHGALSPAEVFVLAGERIKLLELDGEPPSTTASFPYASPQVLDGAAPQAADDVFSFAAIAYEILTGAHPFERRSATAARDARLRPVPPPMLTPEQTLELTAALSFERATRPGDVRMLAKTLAPDPQRVRTIPLDPELESPLPEPSSDMPWWLLAAACGIAMIAAVIVTRLG